MDDFTIMQRLERDYVILVDEGYHVLGVFLYGSQNYHVSTPTSDVDVKAIVLPKFAEVVHGKRISKVYQREHGHLEVFDLVSMQENLLKANINFLEILFTNYYLLNPEYTDYLNELIKKRELIAKIELYRNVHCIYGCYLASKQRVFKQTDSNATRFSKYGYDNKALSNCLRYANYLSRFGQTCTFERMLVPSNMTRVTEMKTNPPDVQEATRILEILDESTSRRRAELLELYHDTKDNETAEWLSQTVLDCYAHSIMKELGGM